jgi:hypothetical protein
MHERIELALKIYAIPRPSDRVGDQVYSLACVTLTNSLTPVPPAGTHKSHIPVTTHVPTGEEVKC